MAAYPNPTMTAPRKSHRRKPTRRPRRRRTGTVQRPVGLATRMPRARAYHFNRSRDELLALENPDATGASDWIQTVDDCLLKTYVFSLDSLPNVTEFTSLFQQYKLNMAILKMFPSYSQIVSTDAPVVSNNIIVTIWPNTTGTSVTAAFTRADLDQIQAKRQWMLPTNKVTTIKMPLNQLDGRYGGGVNVTDYMVMKPQYVSTTEASTPHYGFNIHITKVDKSAFTSNSPRFLMKEKIYLSAKQVK